MGCCVNALSQDKSGELKSCFRQSENASHQGIPTAVDHGPLAIPRVGAEPVPGYGPCCLWGSERVHLPLKIPHDQQAADFLVSFGLMNLLGHF